MKQEAMSSREREEDKNIRRMLGPTLSERERTFNACRYGVSFLDNEKLKIMISCGRLLEVRGMAANVRDLDADKVNDARESIIIPCKARSGNCVNESVLTAKKGKTEYRKSAMLTINLTNFTGNNIPAELVELFSQVIKLAQTNSN